MPEAFFSLVVFLLIKLFVYNLALGVGSRVSFKIWGLDYSCTLISGINGEVQASNCSWSLDWAPLLAPSYLYPSTFQEGFKQMVLKPSGGVQPNSALEKSERFQQIRKDCFWPSFHPHRPLWIWSVQKLARQGSNPLALASILLLVRFLGPAT